MRVRVRERECETEAGGKTDRQREGEIESLRIRCFLRALNITQQILKIVRI
jgi:hypothetical protein